MNRWQRIGVATIGPPDDAASSSPRARTPLHAPQREEVRAERTRTPSHSGGHIPNEHIPCQSSAGAGREASKRPRGPRLSKRLIRRAAAIEGPERARAQIFATAAAPSSSDVGTGRTSPVPELPVGVSPRAEPPVPRHPERRAGCRRASCHWENTTPRTRQAPRHRAWASLHGTTAFRPKGLSKIPHTELPLGEHNSSQARRPRHRAWASRQSTARNALNCQKRAAVAARSARTSMRGGALHMGRFAGGVALSEKR